jgi:hypothetical protein
MESKRCSSGVWQFTQVSCSLRATSLDTLLVVIIAHHGFGLIADSMFESTTPGLTND